MTVLNFPKLFTLEISHSYYEERCQDFAFVTDELTRRLLGRGRLMMREREGVLVVLYEAGASGAPIGSIAGETLHIGLKLRNKAFANFTKLPLNIPPRSLAYTNTQSARALDVPTQFVFAGETFTHTLTSPVRPIDVAIVDSARAVAKVVTVENGEPSASFDLRHVRRGPLVVEERSNGQVTRSDYYLDAELRGDDVFGMVHITIAPDFYGNPPAFNIAFTANADVLRFYVVAQNHSDVDLAELKVEDAGPVDPDLPAAASPPAIVFTALSAAQVDADKIATTLRTGNTDPLAVFESAVEVPRRQRAARRLRLMRKDKELIANLRQPGADQPNAALIIHVSKP